mgnify:FL=1|tara:strand:- start:1033 stop:1431 length:399 start_codon:yes stop_codon:yes gene_type:complete
MNKEKLNSNFLIITFSKDLYKFHYALSMATSLKAINKKVTIFITGYACNYIRKKWEPFDLENINDKLKMKKMATLNELFLYCKDLEIEIYFCSTALDFLDINKDAINKTLDLKPIGMYSILNLHKEEKILFI